jgi:putative phage-type endonuclease
MLSERQLKMRRTGIGASECAVVPGFSPYATVWDLYLDKVHGIGASETAAMRAGSYLENGVAAMYLAELGGRAAGYKLYKDRTRRHRDRPWQLATVDRRVIRDEIPQRIAEVKLPASRHVKNHQTGEYELAWGYSPDEVPPYIACQAQWQMDVTGADECDVVALFCDSRELAIYPQKRNQRLIDSLVAANGRFWTEHVVPRIPPELDGSSAANTYLRQQFPRNAGTMIAAPTEAEDLARRYALAQRAEKDGESGKDDAGNQLRALIGTNDGMIGDWGKATWKLDSRGKVDYKALAEAYRARLDAIGTAIAEGKDLLAEALVGDGAALEAMAEAARRPPERVLRVSYKLALVRPDDPPAERDAA